MGKLLAILAACIVHPIAWPAWAFEWLVRRINPTWEFSPYSATPYFLLLTGGATWLLVFESDYFQWIGLYIVSAMEIVALWLSVVIAIGRPGQMLAYLRRYGRRSGALSTPSYSHDRKRVLYISVVTYFFTVYYFCCLYFAVNAACHECFSKKISGGPLVSFFEFLYFSFVTITTYGYDGIAPNSMIAKIAIMSEITIGSFLTVFVFGSFVTLQSSREERE